MARPAGTSNNRLFEWANKFASQLGSIASQRILGRSTAGTGDPEQLTLSQVLDFVGSAAQGDILYRNGSGWTRLAAGTSGNFLKTNGASANPAWAAVATAGPPTRQYLTSGTAATYTTPAGCTKIIVKMVGAGGGGGAQLTNAGAAGGTTTFNSINANGGTGGTAGIAATTVTGVAGGTGGTGSASLRLNGSGSSVAGNAVGTPIGAPGIFGLGAAAVASGASAGGNGAANTGAGGGGGHNTTFSGAGAGGGAGEYVEIVIASPAATYTYTVGVGGNGGAAGTVAGGNGGSGLIIVEEYYG